MTLLVDVFEKFKNNSFKNYGLCPSRYLSALGLSWDVIVKNELELMTDLDIYIFFLRKVLVMGFLIFLTDIANPTKNI